MVAVSAHRARGGTARIAVDGRASVRECADVRRVLLELLGEGRRVTLDLSGSESADVAFAQLLIAARASFEARQQPLEIHDPAAVLAAAIPCEPEHSAD